MKQDKHEVAAIEAAIFESQIQIAEVEDLQLVMVGGGIGDVVFS